LLHHCDNLPGINGIIRPGIVHRIDKDTSGVLVIAKTENAHHKISAQIKEHSIERVYFSLVHGLIREPRGTINTFIGRSKNDRKKMAVKTKEGKKAITHFKVKERFKNYTYIEARLETGRTHQIRVHMSYIGYPIVGDPKYGPKKPHFNLNGQLLHAAELGFIHPLTNKYVHFSASLPEKFKEILEILRLSS
jgi:23S rRNA pseudouridine1911/1915/1917 synthase